MVLQTAELFCAIQLLSFQSMSCGAQSWGYCICTPDLPSSNTAILMITSSWRSTHSLYSPWGNGHKSHTQVEPRQMRCANPTVGCFSTTLLFSSMQSESSYVTQYQAKPFRSVSSCSLEHPAPWQVSADGASHTACCTALHCSQSQSKALWTFAFWSTCLNGYVL